MIMVIKEAHRALLYRMGLGGQSKRRRNDWERVRRRGERVSQEEADERLLLKTRNTFEAGRRCKQVPVV